MMFTTGLVLSNLAHQVMIGLILKLLQQLLSQTIAHTMLPSLHKTEMVFGTIGQQHGRELHHLFPLVLLSLLVVVIVNTIHEFWLAFLQNTEDFLKKRLTFLPVVTTLVTLLVFIKISFQQLLD